MEGQLEQAAPDRVEVRRGRRVGGLGEIPVAQQVDAVAVVTRQAVDLQQTGYQRLCVGAVVVHLDVDHRRGVERGRLLDQVADPLRALPVVEVAGDQEGVRL